MVLPQTETIPISTMQSLKSYNISITLTNNNLITIVARVFKKTTKTLNVVIHFTGWYLTSITTISGITLASTIITHDLSLIHGGKHWHVCYLLLISLGGISHLSPRYPG